MVHPLLRNWADLTDEQRNRFDEGDGTLSQEAIDEIAGPITSLLPRLHVLVVGPGLGRDSLQVAEAYAALRAARSRGMPAVIDADALGQIISSHPELVRGWDGCVLTPNARELENLASVGGAGDVGIPAAEGGRAEWDGWSAERRRRARGEAIARERLKGATVLCKGPADYVCGRTATLACEAPGAAKRSGGQGDTLTGVLATMLAWRKAYRDRLWPHDGALLVPRGDNGEADETVLLCAYAASAVTRECSRLAFKEKGRSMQASDLTDKVHQAFLNVLGEPEDDRLSEADTPMGKM
jgi:ATP-dependent NAD(P)H-hydrate dehydratase